MITPQKLAEAKQAVMVLNHTQVNCQHCGKPVRSGLIEGPLASILLEALNEYDKDEVRPRISQESESGNNKRSTRRRKGRQKKA